MKRNLETLIAITVLATSSFAASVNAQDLAAHFKGKTIKVVFGTKPGGSYGFTAQLSARNLGRFIPGNPTMVTESRPGASGLVALNYLANVAPKDGSVLAVPTLTIVQEGMFNKKVKYDPAKFRFIGRLTDSHIILMASKQSGVTSLDDARKREVVVGASGAFNATALLPQTLNKMAGTQFKVITGYTGTSRTYLAMFAGEVEAAATSYDTIRAKYTKQLGAGEIVPIAVFSTKRLKDFPNMPAVTEFGKSDVDNAFLKISTVATEIGRSLIAPPGISADRLGALRAAYQKMIKDDAFLAEVKRIKFDLVTASGEELEGLVRDTVNLDKATIAKAAQIYYSLKTGVTKKKKQK